MDHGSCVVNFKVVDSVTAAIALMGEELVPGHPLKVDFGEKRGSVWDWLPEPQEGDDIKKDANSCSSRLLLFIMSFFCCFYLRVGFEI